MSYLDPLRVHFAGRFQAAISTVNNDPLHFDNATFKPEYQLPQTDTEPNGWFNPRGSGTWRLLECAVTTAWLADGTAAPAADPVLAALVADSDRQPPAKLADLDPQQQLASTIWGLEVRVATPEGDNLLRGRFEPAAFMDLWARAQGSGAQGDVAQAAMYQSVLTDVEWGDVTASAVLTALRAASAPGLLSVKFNLDGINFDAGSPRFLIGRIAGTLGPADVAEPRHFVTGRQLMTSSAGPASGINFCVGVLDRATRRVHLDLGNALPTTTPGGPAADLGPIELRAATAATPGQSMLVGQLQAQTYTEPGWYERTAGVVALPADRPLTDAELTRLESTALFLTTSPTAGRPRVAASEPPGGVFVRADQVVARLNPGEQAAVPLHASRFGRPYPGAAVLVVRYNDQFQAFSTLGEAPMVGIPEDAIDYPVRLVTDERGTATLTVTAADPGTPRGYLDGQLYGLYPVLEETVVSPAAPYPFDPWAFVSVAVWSGFQPDEPPTWYGSIQPVLRQYANLYPVMDRFLDLGDYDSVCAHVRPLTEVFALDVHDPNAMPVTRDLSAAKRAAVLRWLREPGADGKPRKGTPPADEAPAAPQVARLVGAPRTPLADPSQGGKTAALSRRLVVQRPASGSEVQP